MYFNTKIEVSYFDLNTICQNPTIIINAKRGSGKSTMVRELMNYFNSTLHYPVCVLCSYSEKVDPYYSFFFIIFAPYYYKGIKVYIKINDANTNNQWPEYKFIGKA